MKKRLLAAVIAASTTAYASTDTSLPLPDSTKEWYTSAGGSQTIQAVNIDSEPFAISWHGNIYTRGDGSKSIGITYPDKYCDGFESEVRDLAVMKWNDTFVKMSHQCIGEEFGMAFPTTTRGASYVWGQFLKSNYVYVVYNSTKTRFSAKGFRVKAQRYIEEQSAL